MHRPASFGGVVDIIAVDPDERRALLDQRFGAVAAQQDSGALAALGIAAAARLFPRVRSSVCTMARRSISSSV